MNIDQFTTLCTPMIINEETQRVTVCSIDCHCEWCYSIYFPSFLEFKEEDDIFYEFSFALFKKKMAILLHKEGFFTSTKSCLIFHAFFVLTIKKNESVERSVSVNEVLQKLKIRIHVFSSASVFFLQFE